MTEDTRDPAVTGEVGGEATGGAALIATFYGSRDDKWIRALHQRFYEKLGPPGRDEQAPNVWSNLPETTGLCFHPPGKGAHDATVVQLGINAAGSAATAWEELGGKLEDVLEAGEPEGIWGYTLVYQAVLREGFDPEAVLEQVLPAARRLHSAERLNHPIRTFEVAGGRVCLLSVPERGDGPEAGMVYGALAVEGGEDDLLRQFYSTSGSTAKLVPPDLMAHKGYYQIRQYRREDLESSYDQRLEDLQGATDRLLEDLRLDTDKSPDRLNELFGLYSRLLSTISSLKNLQVKVGQQSDNLYGRRSQFTDNEALEFHQAHLDAAIRELESKVEPLQFDLEIADKAVSAARLQMDKEQEERSRESEKEEEREKKRQEALRLEEEKEDDRHQQLMYILLAVVAAVLALPELIDKALAGWFIGRLPMLEPFAGSTLAEFLVQIVLIVIFASPLLIWLGVWLWRNRWSKSQSSEGTETYLRR